MIKTNKNRALEAILLGFGNVGRALVREQALRREKASIKGVLSSRGGVVVKHEADYNQLLELAEKGMKLDKHPRFKKGMGLETLLKETQPELAFVTIPPSYKTGEPNLSYYKTLLNHGIHVITADKTGLALSYKQLMTLARQHNAYIGYRATVAAGTPAIDVLKGLRGREIKRIQAIMNACTNYLLSLIEQGYSWEKAIEKARKEELTEPDPTIDTHGWDPAAKITILANELGLEKTLKEVERKPIDTINEETIREKLKKGKKTKYIATIDVIEKKLTVEPMELDRNHPLANVNGIYNAMWIDLENEHIYIEGPAGPAWRTAKVMCTDLNELIYTIH